MRNRESIIKSITSHFAVLKTEVELRSKLNLQDINVHAEQFYKILLNKIFSYDLVNVNITEPNAAVIDLADAGRKIAFQVTSNNSKSKILETVNSFNEKKLFEKYNTLKILIIKSRIKRNDIITHADFSFDMDKDVMDVKYIISIISSIDDLGQLEDIEKWLSNELIQKYYGSKLTSKPNEINTIMCLIDILSNEDNHKAYEAEAEPDPEYKIEQRFKDYAPFLKNLYSELYIEYAYALEVIQESPEISSVKIRKIGTYLKDISRKYLKSSNDNPEEALENLCDFFKKLCSDDGLDFDEMAIKFYLLHQLIRCNVFPN
ncbi:SMEK domain-containing protein [Flavobacterium psychrotrophum]|uniref:SMEK domain-containing protein n=1 Tax=Flavobacterium psychrotrophum TaxID=2294119 RepID=UPI000E3204A2|nr:SMEK domain-containing protein [Flavobacterium psychrotrophum]